MYYVYILHSRKDNKLYTGCTNNLQKRLELHNSGKIFSTKYRLPLSIIYYEAYGDKEDAFQREKYLKTGWGRSYIRRILKNYLQKHGYENFK